VRRVRATGRRHGDVGDRVLTRPRLSVFIATSVDGFIAAPDGSLDWLHAAARDGEDYGFDAFLEVVDALAMGRGTYDQIASLDPLPYGGRPVYVFTHRPPRERDGVTFWSTDPDEAVERWAASGFGRVYVDGGALIRSFLAARLIDDLTITVAPVVLGAGVPLFAGGPAVELTLTGVTPFPSGMTTLRYETRR
jgi:dihydrofolate reductase